MIKLAALLSIIAGVLFIVVDFGDFHYHSSPHHNSRRRQLDYHYSNKDYVYKREKMKEEHIKTKEAKASHISPQSISQQPVIAVNQGAATPLIPPPPLVVAKVVHQPPVPTNPTVVVNHQAHPKAVTSESTPTIALPPTMLVEKVSLSLDFTFISPSLYNSIYCFTLFLPFLLFLNAILYALFSVFSIFYFFTFLFKIKLG
jgi:hypothetical protein